MKTIKFSHNYPKLHGQKTATLKGWDTWTGEALKARLPEFVEYDTLRDDGTHYKIENNKFYIILLLWGDKRIPFTTIRECTDRNKAKYINSVGKQFKIEVG